MQTPYSFFRKIAFIEGISYLVLLFIAMPLKYFANMPMAVTIVGGIHGVLFVAFIIALCVVWKKYQKSFLWAFKAFVSSLIPFGTFYMDRFWKIEESSVKAGV